MATISDILARMQRNPKDIRFNYLCKICDYYLYLKRLPNGRMMMTHDKYTYSITWAEEDGEYVGLCADFPSLSWLAETQNAAFNGIRQVVKEVIFDMKIHHESVPNPIMRRLFMGNVPADTQIH